MAQLQLKSIHKVYENGFHAVHDFSISIEKGEFIVFVGPSGCGKSTSLRMIAGLEDITEGELYIGGKLSNDKSPRDRGIAMVFQSYALYPHMTVYENMAFGLSLKGLDEDIIEMRVKRTAKILGLDPYLDRFPRELSGGQRQRVAVGRAIIRHVEVFLMDEPLSNLDAKQRVSMRAEIINIHRSIGATTVYVTHDQTEAMTMADRIVVMKDGYVQQIGTPYELYFNPANQFVAGFIGEPPMNFLPCEQKDGCLYARGSADAYYAFAAKRPELFKAANGTPIVLGFRPEGIRLLAENEKAPEGGFTFGALVDLTEMLGDNANLYLDLAGHSLISKVTPHEIPSVDFYRTFHVSEENLYFFNEETGMALRTGEH